MEAIHMMRRWEGGDPGVVNHKAPTIILLTPTGEFHSFGFTARDFYHDLSPRQATKWLYFEKFKLVLHTDKVGTTVQRIAANQGRVQGLDFILQDQRFCSKEQPDYD